MLRKTLLDGMGIRPDDGVIIAWIPRADQVPTTEYYLDEPFYIWETNDSYMLTDSTTPLRWWQVKHAARQLGYDHPEPVWTGQASDLSVECLPQLDRSADNLQLALRSYHHGPWVTNFQKDIL